METLHEPPPDGTLKAALDRLLERTRRRVADGTRAAATLAMQHGHARFWLDELGPGLELDALDEFRLEALVEALRGRESARGRPLALKTIQKRISTLHAAHELAHRKRACARVPAYPAFEFPPQHGPRHRWFASWEEAEHLRSQLPPERADWIAVALYTGQHAADVERATWDDVQLEGPDAPAVRLRNTKNRKPPRWVRCPDPLAKILRARLERLRRAGRAPAPGDPLVKRWTNRHHQLGRLCVRLGVAPINATGLRHSATTFAVQQLGISIGVQKWFGWSSFAQMETTYAHALKPALDQVAAALSGPRRPPRARRRSRRMRKAA